MNKRITIIPSDKIVIIDGVTHEIEFDCDPNYHAVQWHGEEGVIETKKGDNIKIENLEKFEDIVAAHEEKTAENKRLREEYENSPQKVIDDFNRKRILAYPDIGEQFDAIWKQLNQDRLDGKELVQEADNVLNAVLAVKKNIPKPKEVKERK